MENEIKYKGLWKPQYMAEFLFNRKGMTIQDVELHLKSWATDIIEVNKAHQWISVKDELPKENIKVLVCLTYGSGKEEIKTSYYSNRTESFDYFMSEIITHWMPLINPPSKCIG